MKFKLRASIGVAFFLLFFTQTVEHSVNEIFVDSLNRPSNIAFGHCKYPGIDLLLVWAGECFLVQIIETVDTAPVSPIFEQNTEVYEWLPH